MIIEKDILTPGSYLTARGVAHFPPARLTRIARAGNALIADGFRPQIPYEHHDESEPVEERLSFTETDKLKHNTGFVDKWYFRKNDKGQDVLWATLDVRDPKAAADLGNTILFCSPQINDQWTSGKGQTYLDCPIHVALTNKPVIQDQQPFEPTPSGTFRLSCAVPLRPNAVPLRPAAAFPPHRATRLAVDSGGVSTTGGQGKSEVHSHADIRKSLEMNGGNSDKVFGAYRDKVKRHLATGGKVSHWLDGKQTNIAKVEGSAMRDDKGQTWGMLPLAAGKPGSKTGLEFHPRPTSVSLSTAAGLHRPAQRVPRDGITGTKPPAALPAGKPTMRNFRKTMFSMAPDGMPDGGPDPLPPTPDAPDTDAVDVTAIAASLSSLSGDEFMQCLSSLPPEKQAEFKAALAGAAPAPEPMPEPNPNGTALSLAQLMKDNDPRNERIARQEAKDLCRQLDDLVETGRILPVRAGQLKNRLNGTTRLSLCLDGYGELGEVVKEIEIRQGLKAGSEAPVAGGGTSRLSIPERPSHARKDNKASIQTEEKIGEEMAAMG